MRFWIDNEGIDQGGLAVNVSRARSGGDTPDDEAERCEWLKGELTGCSFPDARLDDRLRKLLEGMAGAIGESLPTACQDWANTKAAYRFFDNDRVSEEAILDGHFRATAERVAACSDPVLVLHDTTEFTYKRGDPRKIGLIGKVADYRVCGPRCIRAWR